MRFLLRAFPSLRHPAFRLLLGGQVASGLGDMAYAVALPWYVLSEHGGVLLLGAVLAAYGIPRTALIALGGHASDRFGPWTTMMSADGVRALVAAVLAVAAASQRPSALLLVPIAVVLGAGEGLFLPGSFSIIPALLPAEDLQAGNALASAGAQLATLAGPVAGGVVVALLGPGAAFGIDAGSFAISALTLAGIRSLVQLGAGTMEESSAVPGSGEAAQPSSPPGRTAATSVSAVVRTERVLQIILFVNVVANLGSGGLDQVALADLAHGPLGAGAGGYGALLAAFGGGALLGTILASQVGSVRRPAFVGSLVFLGDALFLAVAPFLFGIVGAGLALALAGACNGFANILTITAFQRWAPPALLGRLMGLLLLTSFGAFPASVVVAALVVHSFGPAPFFPLAGAALGGALLLGLSQRAWREFGAVPPPASVSGDGL